MWSFEGEHRKRPNVSLSGASRLMDKTAFLEKLRKEREARENNKKREVAAVRLQSFIRGSLCRIHTNQLLRSVYDELLQSVPTPLSEAHAKTLCLKMLRLYRPKLDSHRLVSLCSLLVRNSLALQQWMVSEPLLWRHILSEFIQFSLKTIAESTQNTGLAAPQHAGPLRLLEVLTLPQRGKPSPLTPQQQADRVFGLLIMLIKKGYFKHLIALLVAKVPPVDERCTKSHSPLAASLLSHFLYPIYLVAACRRPSEFWDASAQLDNTQLWDRVCGSDNSASLSSALPPDATSGDKSRRESAGQEGNVKQIVSSATDKESVPQLTSGSVSLQSSEVPDDEPMELVLPRKDEATSNSGSVCRSKVAREEDIDSTNKGKVLRRSDPEDECSHTSAVGVDFSSSGGTDRVLPVTNIEESSASSSCTAGREESVTRPAAPGERGNKLLCNAFDGVATDAPANYINLCLYNLVKEVFAASAASQVHHLLVPRIEESQLLLRHPAATHALLQAVHHVLAPSRGDAVADSGTAVDPYAPTKLATLLSLVPVKTSLTTTGLQLYLQSIKELVRHTALFLPQKLSHTAGGEGTQEEEDPESDDDLDEDEDDEMEVDGGASSDRTLKLLQKPPDHLVELGEWCLQHINSPGYVSWLLDEVETTGLDREVLVEFCGLTHTLLTAPCLSLFQCRLMYGVVGRQRMQRAMWGLLTSLYPSWVSTPSAAHDRRERSE